MSLLNTKNVADHFGISLTAEFIETTLKVPAHSAEKRARFWEPSALPKIGEALAKYAVVRGSATPVAPAPKPEKAAAPAAAPAPAADDNEDLF